MVEVVLLGMSGLMDLVWYGGLSVRRLAEQIG